MVNRAISRWELRRRRSGAMAVGLVAGVLAPCSSAQWTAVNLHPSGDWAGSRAYGGTGDRAVGAVFIEGLDTVEHAGYWSGSAASWVSLEPPGAIASAALGASSEWQVGYSGFPFQSTYRKRAALWSGDAASFVDLHPLEALSSEALAVGDGFQVGFAVLQGAAHAVRWSGSAAAWTDLHPAGATTSTATAVTADAQVGFAEIGGARHASLWQGSAASWINLHPAGATDSQALGAFNDRQVGSATVNGASRAGLWQGSAASWVDLTPVGAESGVAAAILKELQVGHAVVDGIARASVWSGNADSWVDLGAFAPAEFSETYATGIWSDGDLLYVSGYGLNTVSGRVEALQWSVPEPGSLLLTAVGAGALLLPRHRRS